MVKDALHLVLACDYRVPDPEELWDKLARTSSRWIRSVRTTSSCTPRCGEPGRIFVTVGIHNGRPVEEVVRSPLVFAWFDLADVEEIPPVFAGEVLEKIDVGDREHDAAPTGIIVAAIATVTDLPTVVENVHASLRRFGSAGVRKVWIYRAVDDRNEVMILQEIDSETSAADWIDDPDKSAEWMGTAGVRTLSAAVRRYRAACDERRPPTVTTRSGRRGPRCTCVCATASPATWCPNAWQRAHVPPRRSRSHAGPARNAVGVGAPFARSSRPSRAAPLLTNSSRRRAPRSPRRPHRDRCDRARPTSLACPVRLCRRRRLPVRRGGDRRVPLRRRFPLGGRVAARRRSGRRAAGLAAAVAGALDPSATVGGGRLRGGDGRDERDVLRGDRAHPARHRGRDRVPRPRRRRRDRLASGA